MARSREAGEERASSPRQSPQRDGAFRLETSYALRNWFFAANVGSSKREVTARQATTAEAKSRTGDEGQGDRDLKSQAEQLLVGTSGGAGSRLRTRLGLPQTRVYPVLTAQTGKSAVEKGAWALLPACVCSVSQSHAHKIPSARKQGTLHVATGKPRANFVRMSFLMLIRPAAIKLGRYDVG